MDYSHIRGIIFDLGSTLIEFESRPWGEINLDGNKRVYDGLSDLNHTLPDFDTFNNRLEEIKQEYRIAAVETLAEWRAMEAFEKLLTEFGVADPTAQSRRCMDIYYSLVREGFELCVGAADTVKELKRSGFRTGMISNTIFPASLHEYDLDMLDLMPYIDFRIYSSDFGHRKPFAGIYEEGLRLIGLPAGNTLFVGDRYDEDVAGPQKAGMAAVLKYHEGRVYPDPMPNGFPVIYRIDQILNIVNQKR